MSNTIRPAVKGDLNAIVKIAQLVAPYAENIPYLYPEEYRQDHLKRPRKGYRFCLFSQDFILMVAKVPDSGTPGDIDMQGSNPSPPAPSGPNDITNTTYEELTKEPEQPLEKPSDKQPPDTSEENIRQCRMKAFNAAVARDWEYYQTRLG
ncbi:hypothetical protein QC762_206815 [Podospora pseudocomata]|uniref:N-acetyltransferase domain-containing protein n=1 Tax=Podospora pseudocomata TaxID=2093779 RepID=A0ABR0GLV6_9PEZI|nr:hypothetical protein QC762_206815 [Podospora pseudocomata]